MQITQVSNQFIQPPTKTNKDPFMNSLMKAKENLTSQMQKINEDKSIDENTKQEKLKQLQTQMDELVQQMSKRQLEKLAEDSAKSITEPSKSTSDSGKTAEERKNEADVAMGKSLISATMNKEHLTQLGAIRRRLISEDGGISERVQRTERMMASRTQEINKSLAENQKAVQESAQSSKEVEEDRRADKASDNQENDNGVDKPATASGDDTQQSVDTKQPNEAAQLSDRPITYESSDSKSKSEINDLNVQQSLLTNKLRKPAQKAVSRGEVSNIDVLL